MINMTWSFQRAYHNDLHGHNGSLDRAHSHHLICTRSCRPKRGQTCCQAVQNEQMISKRADAVRLLQRVAAMIADKDDLLPFDPDAFNLPLAIWWGTLQTDCHLKTWHQLLVLSFTLFSCHMPHLMSPDARLKSPSFHWF